ncbi:hypothetical protein L1987_07076 [Smallanthus sonchifolius]|uniref:Uncharacterized protein n=1 Tax=Smallanthus sonchifolius TaxID=185202 RepID=A0ACB9JZU4_9ASTR|nr:hypothetical protein L1987_07076 [Smallanthus sonchifolius]
MLVLDVKKENPFMRHCVMPRGKTCNLAIRCRNWQNPSKCLHSLHGALISGLNEIGALSFIAFSLIVEELLHGITEKFAPVVTFHLRFL